ncbi:Uncharacterised protein [Chlamydia trachomatis]|nr:Uncharacterised protein [Chlamydia trachomatis]
MGIFLTISIITSKILSSTAIFFFTIFEINPCNVTETFICMAFNLKGSIELDVNELRICSSNEN